MALIQDPETKRKEAETRLIALRAQQEQLEKDIKQAEREAKGIAEIAPGVTRARNVAFIDFNMWTPNGVEFDSTLDPNEFDEPSFYASHNEQYSDLAEYNSIDAALAKAEYWKTAYTEMADFFKAQKEMGIHYIVDEDECSAEDFVFDHAPKKTARKRK